MNIQYEVNSGCSAEEVSLVFKSSGIRRPTDDLKRLQKMIEHADEIVTARDNGKLTSAPQAETFYEKIGFERDQRTFVVKRER